MAHGARATAEFTNAIQRWTRDSTRLGIPVLFHEEALHGIQAPEATSFPQAIALASSWNPALVERGRPRSPQRIDPTYRNLIHAREMQGDKDSAAIENIVTT